MPDPLLEAATEEQSRANRLHSLRHRGHRVLVRSVHMLPSLATLANAICGFGAIYVAGMAVEHDGASLDPLTRYFAAHRFVVAAWLIFLAMAFDALDGRLARFTRHTTDFGGQLDSLADVISFGAAPAFVALQLFHDFVQKPLLLTRSVWAIGALYMSCAAIRLARFNVSNQHGEQHHYSFLGLPSPGAAAAVAAFILMHQHLFLRGETSAAAASAAWWCVMVLPILLLATGLLMVSGFRYPHLVNRYLRGRRSLRHLVLALICLLLVAATRQYAVALGTLIYAMWGPAAWVHARLKPSPSPQDQVPGGPT